MYCVVGYHHCCYSSMWFLHMFRAFIIFFQSAANYVVSQLVVWEIEFPGGISNSNIKWRAFMWGVSEVLLLISVSLNYLPPRLYSRFLRLSTVFIMLDFVLTIILLPIGVSKTYGFCSAKDVFTKTCMYIFVRFIPCSYCVDNGTGAYPAWNWIPSLRFGSFVQGLALSTISQASTRLPSW